MSQGVEVAGLYVRDQDEALAFYVDKLGFRVHTDVRNGDYRWLTVQHPEQPSFQLGLFVPAPPVHEQTIDPTPETNTASVGNTDIGSGGATQELAYASPLRPSYPFSSVRAREQGTVLLRVLVDENGAPQKVEIARSSGHARLDASAREAVSHARFRPVLRDGRAVSVWGIVPIAFRLDNV